MENNIALVADARITAPKMKMVFHFPRVADSDIKVEGDTISECTQKAYDERMKQVVPVKIVGEVTE